MRVIRRLLVAWWPGHARRIVTRALNKQWADVNDPRQSPGYPDRDIMRGASAAGEAILHVPWPADGRVYITNVLRALEQGLDEVREGFDADGFQAVTVKEVQADIARWAGRDS